jgi:hypothetical protein
MQKARGNRYIKKVLTDIPSISSSWELLQTDLNDWKIIRERERFWKGYFKNYDIWCFINLLNHKKMIKCSNLKAFKPLYVDTDIISQAKWTTLPWGTVDNISQQNTSVVWILAPVREPNNYSISSDTAGSFEVKLMSDDMCGTWQVLWNKSFK